MEELPCPDRSLDANILLGRCTNSAGKEHPDILTLFDLVKARGLLTPEAPPRAESRTNRIDIRKSHSRPPQLNFKWWIPADGIRRDVIQADIERYLGPESVVRPGEGRDADRVIAIILSTLCWRLTYDDRDGTAFGSLL